MLYCKGFLQGAGLEKITHPLGIDGQHTLCLWIHRLAHIGFTRMTFNTPTVTPLPPSKDLSVVKQSGNACLIVVKAPHFSHQLYNKCKQARTLPNNNE